MGACLSKHPVIALEEDALARWCNGDPSGFLEICAPDVVYFDPFRPTRLNGIEELTAYYESVRGQIHAPYHKMIDAHVQEVGDAAILTFRFNSSATPDGPQMRWNCTEVYRKEPGQWRIIQTHWSFTAAQEA